MAARSLLRISLFALVACSSPTPEVSTTQSAAEAGTPPTPSYSRNLPDSVTGTQTPVAVTGTSADCSAGSPCFIAESNLPSGEIDSYFHDVYERPAGQGSGASTYHPAIDIASADTGVKPTWVFYRLNLFGPEPGNAPGTPGSLPHFYSVEVNFDDDPMGDCIIELTAPSSMLGNSFSTNGVVVKCDQNESLGGGRPLLADGPGQAGGGYEKKEFDSGANSAPGQEGGTTAIQARVTGNSIEIAVFRPFLESLTTDVVSGAGFRPYAARTSVNPSKLYTHDDKNRGGIGSPYPFLELTGAPASCPGGASGDDGITVAQRNALESGTRVNTGILNPCYAVGSVYELDNAGTIASLAEKDDVVFDVDLVITKSDSPDPATVGQPLTYTLTVQNVTAGTGQATNVMVTDTLPPTVTFVSASAGCTHVTSVVLCMLGNIASGASKVVTITVTPNVAGSISNTAVVTSDGDELTPGNNVDSEGTTVNPAAPLCPNGVLNPGEACDDGNQIPNDGCESNCKKSNGEQCTDDDECDSDICNNGICQPPNTCGNGVREGAEVCDDGNQTPNDGCENDCKLSDGEQCDDDDDCESGICLDGECQPNNACGNGVREGNEICDDGNQTPNDGCENNCKLSLGEPCDDDGDCNSNTCDEEGSDTCEPPNTCGNGHVEGNEACDDGGTANGDGCSSTCLLEDGEPCTDDNDCQSGECDGEPKVCGGPDTDRDGIRDFIDLDDDNDGLLDTAEGSRQRDTDGDGAPDAVDLDSDNDGLPDANEAGHGAPDKDGDYFVDCPALVGGNGFCNSLETMQDSGIAKFGSRDNDGDQVLDYVDLDGDNDGISDLHEGGSKCADTNDDGVCDKGLDMDKDGVVQSIDGLLGAFGNSGAMPATDFDMDGMLDVHDLDSDNDQLWDLQESKNAALDQTSDGVIDSVTDGDDDGIRDVADDSDLDGTNDDQDTDPKKFGGLHDSRQYTDEDADPDHQDADGDGDGHIGDDNCPQVDNPDQSDVDGDGLGDACDPNDDRFGVAGGGCGCQSNGSAGSLLFGLALLWILTTRRSRSRMIAALFACVFAIPATSQAQVIEAELSVERFQLATDADGILDVESGRVREHGQLDLALWLGYANDPLTVYKPMGNGHERTHSLVSNQVGGELVGSVGFFNRLQLGLAVPLIFSQSDSVDDSATMPSAPGSSFAVGDLRVAAKAQLLFQKQHELDLSIVAAVTFPTGSGDGYVGDTWLTFSPMLAATRSFGSGVRGAANIGYRAREQRDTSTLIVNDEIFAGLGAAYDLRGNDGPPLELELGFGYATAAGDAFGAFNRNYAEIKPGVSYDFTGPLLAFVASGFGVAEGFGTPDWRVLAGVRLDRKMAPEPKPIPDTDRDGFLDNVDKCINDPEDRDAFEDHDGCPDLDDDKDGVPDTADQCRLEPEDKDSFEDENGCPDPDNDKDKILDTADKCPNEPEDYDSFEDENGCPETDNDLDTVLDPDDTCPIIPGPVENKGCPWPDRDNDGVIDKLDNCPDWAGRPEFHGCNGPQLVKITESKLELLETILFASNRTTIQRKSFKILDAAALVIKNHPEMRIEIEGHTDDRGSDTFNLKLSDGRAESVKKYFIKKGVGAERLSSKGYGESQPITENKTALGRGKNRRVEFLIVRDVTTSQPVPSTAPAIPAPAPAPAPAPKK